jgi:hypothetical protein
LFGDQGVSPTVNVPDGVDKVLVAVVIYLFLPLWCVCHAVMGGLILSILLKKSIYIHLDLFVSVCFHGVSKILNNSGRTPRHDRTLKS